MVAAAADAGVDGVVFFSFFFFFFFFFFSQSLYRGIRSTFLIGPSAHFRDEA